MTPRVLNGWLIVPYDGSERLAVHISTEPDKWAPAFLDYLDSVRVAKIRVSAVPGTILRPKLRAGSTETAFPSIRV